MLTHSTASRFVDTLAQVSFCLVWIGIPMPRAALCSQINFSIPALCMNGIYVFPNAPDHPLSFYMSCRASTFLVPCSTRSQRILLASTARRSRIPAEWNCPKSLSIF